MKKYKSPETIDMSDLLNEIEQKNSPQSVSFIKQALAIYVEKTKVDYAYQISTSPEDNDWNDPINDHWDNY